MLTAQQVPGIMCSPTCVPSPKIIVISPSGDDSRSGHCAPNLINAEIAGTPSLAGCAKKTVNGIVPVGGAIYGLVYGSIFQDDGLTITDGSLKSITFGAIGNPALGQPIVDSSANIAINSGSWSSDGAGAYSMTITTTGGNGSISIFEAGVFLQMAVSKAVCDATPNTYFSSLQGPSNWTGSGTVYIHPAAGGNPSSNGIQYSYTDRLYGLSTWVSSTFNYPSIYNITTRRQLGNNGSVTLGDGGFAYGLNANQGGYHNMLIGSQTTLVKVTLRGANVSNSGNVLVAYDDTASGTGINITNLVVDGTGSVGGSMQSFFTHLGSGSLGTIAFDGVTLENSVTGIQNGSGSTMSINNITGDSTVTGCVSVSAPTTISNLVCHATTADISVGSGATGTCTNCQLLGGNPIPVTGSGSVLNLINSTLGSSVYVSLSSSGAVGTATGNTFNGFRGYFTSGAQSATVTISEGNKFCNGSATNPASLNGTLYTVGTWQGLGHDLMSQFGGC